jgi:uncharacterized protein (TIGR02996 family)
MDHDGAFLQAIRDEPGDDAPRLIYADWLDDHGGPAGAARAAFIRAQVLLASLPEADPARAGLEDEADDLLAEHEEPWLGGLRPLLLDWEFRRGFVERISVRAEVFLDQADRLFAAPVRAARLVAEPRDLPALAQCPYLAGLEALDLSGAPRYEPFRRDFLRDSALRALFESPYLTRLTALSLPGHGLQGPALAALAGCGVLDRLTHLDLSNNATLGDRGVRVLAEAGAERLQVLRLKGTNLTAAGALALLHATTLPRLHSLRFDPRALFSPDRGPSAALDELLAAPLLGRLSDLDLTGAPLGAGGARTLAAAPALANLTALVLERCPLGDGVRALASSPHLARLKILDLGYTGLGSAGLEDLAESANLPGLRSLRLTGNGCRDKGARALAQAPFLPQLTALDLGSNGIGGPGLAALTAAPHLRRLRELNLSDNFIGPATLGALLRLPQMGQLRRLDLGRVRLGPQGVRALAELPELARLRALGLSGNLLGDEGVQALAASPYLSRLRELDLGGNGISPPGAEALLAAPHLRRLAKVGLTNTLADQEARQRLRDWFGERVTF